MDGNLLQTAVFQNIFILEKDISRHKGSKEGVCMVQRQIGKNYLSIPRESGQLYSFNPILHLSLPKIGLAYPHRNYIFETIDIKDRAIVSQSMAILA